VAVVDGSGVVINIDVLDINKGSNASHLLTQKDLVAGKLHVPFLVKLVLLLLNISNILLLMYIVICFLFCFICHEGSAMDQWLRWQTCVQRAWVLFLLIPT